jgi:hypothetical protein
MGMAASSPTTIHEPLLVYFPNYLLLLEIESKSSISNKLCTIYILMNHDHMIYVQNVAPDGFMMFLKGMYMKIMGKR